MLISKSADVIINLQCTVNAHLRIQMHEKNIKENISGCFLCCLFFIIFFLPSFYFSIDTPLTNKYAIALNTIKYDQTLLQKFSTLVMAKRLTYQTLVVSNSIARLDPWSYYLTKASVTPGLWPSYNQCTIQNCENRT